MDVDRFMNGQREVGRLAQAWFVHYLAK